MQEGWPGTLLREGCRGCPRDCWAHLREGNQQRSALGARLTDAALRAEAPFHRGARGGSESSPRSPERSELGFEPACARLPSGRTSLPALLRPTDPRPPPRLACGTHLSGLSPDCSAPPPTCGGLSPSPLPGTKSPPLLPPGPRAGSEPQRLALERAPPPPGKSALLTHTPHTHPLQPLTAHRAGAHQPQGRDTRAHSQPQTNPPLPQ